MTKIMIFLLMIALGFTNSMAQVAQEEEAEKELQAIKKITQLTQEHEFLQSWEGTWKLQGLNHAGGESSPLNGTVEITPIMFGHYIEMNLKVEKFGGYMTTRMIIGFDTRIGRFSLYSFDDVTNYSEFSTGTKSGNKISFSGKNFNLNKKKELPFRIDIELERENKLTMKLYFIDGKKEFLNTEYQFIKKMP